MTKAVGYIRVSTQGQVRDGCSLAYQRDEIMRYCAENQIELIAIYEDKGISGAKVDEEELTVEREGLQEMLADLEGNQVSLVVVLNTSRLWRSDMTKVLIQRALKRYRVDVRAIEQQTYSIYNYDPNDFLVNGMLELLDQYQRLEIALKLSRGRRKKAEQGGYAGGGTAFGYTAVKGQKILHIDTEHAETVRRTFELRHQFPTWTLKDIAHQLNAEGYTTRQGKPFRKVQVKRILDHAATYKGTYRYGRVEAAGVHATIL